MINLREPEPEEIPVAWSPLPPFNGFPSSQSLALACRCDEILYHGTRGASKTETQIAYFLQFVGKGYGAHWKGIIFDRGYKNLGDIIAKTRTMIPKIFPKAKFLSAKSDLMWKFPDGEILMFRHIKRPSDYLDYHGQEFPFIGWNELTSYPTSELYDKLKSCNRSGFLPLKHSPTLTKADLRTIKQCDLLDEPYPQTVHKRLLPDIPLVTFSTTNPKGPGHTWVKKRFVDKSPPGVPIKTIQRVFNPRTGEEEDVLTSQVAIFGCYKENIYLDAKYIAYLDSIKDPQLRRAWLGGDWSITSGGALDDLWKPTAHVLPRFVVPKGWRVTRSFDWGSSHPFSVGFWAIANGEEVEVPGYGTFCPSRGSLVRFGEIYGCELIKDESGRLVPNYGSNKGLRLAAREVARRIAEKQDEFVLRGWLVCGMDDDELQRHIEDGGDIPVVVEPGPADGQIFNVNEAESDSIAKLMASEGIEWYAADKSAGTRKNGLELLRTALENSIQREGPGLYVMDNCKSFLETVPSLPRDEDDPDDVDTCAEDHIYDETRYMILDDKPVFSGDIDVDMAV